MLERPVALPFSTRRIRALLLSVVTAVAALALTTTVVAPAGATAGDDRQGSIEVRELDAVDRADIATAPTPDDHLQAHTWAVVPGRVVIAHPVMLATEIARGARPAESEAVPAPRDRAPPERAPHR